LLAAGSLALDNHFLPDCQALFTRLTSSIAWDERMRARQAASFGVPYNYSGISWPACPFPDDLVPVLERVATRVGWRPNNCLAHFYPDGRSTMGFHSDATDELETATGIAVVSLGAERTITFRHQAERRLEQYPLLSGSLLVMSRTLQADWKHAILAAEGLDGGRISLTFRCMKVPGPGTAAGERPV
jgi:alkylated DNA repair dioxygenase AlkB